MKVCVIGANGKIGSVLTKYLTQTGRYNVVAICRNQVGAASLAPLGCEVRLGSITNRGEGDRLLEDCDVVINCALAVGLPKKAKSENLEIIRVIADAEKTKLILYLSTVAVYGSCADSDERHFVSPRPNTPYGKMKLRLEHQAIRAFRKAGVRYCILRVGHVFGPHQWLSREVIELSKSHKFFLPFGGHRPSNAIHVERLVRSFEGILMSPLENGVYNVTEANRSWYDVFDWHVHVLGLPEVKECGPKESEFLQKRLRQLYGRFLFKKNLSDISRIVYYSLLSGIANNESVRGMMYRLMSLMPGNFEERVKGIYAVRMARRDINELKRDPFSTVRPWHFWSDVPGKGIPVPKDKIGFEDDLNRQLKAWWS